jgi:WD repeat-containing protein 89
VLLHSSSTTQFAMDMSSSSEEPTTLTANRTIVTSFNPKTTTASEGVGDYFEDGDWVLSVTGGHKWVACALSNGEVQVYDQERMHRVQTYRHPENALVTDLVADGSSTNSSTLVSTATDGTINIFDVRQSQCACQLRCQEQALSASIGFDGNLAAVGTNKAKIHFYDIRNSRSLLGTYSQSHTQEVTQVRFQTKTSFGATATTPVLVSAGEDGLVCVFDTSQPSEETALQNVLPVQSPIRKVGFFGPQAESIYCLTGDESLKLYTLRESACKLDFGLQLRDYLTRLYAPQSAPIDYLVDCFWNQQRQELLLFAGNKSGDTGIFNVREIDITLCHRLTGGHRGVVRAVSALSNNDIFVTAGEDARLCEWNRMGRPVSAQVAHAVQVPVPPLGTGSPLVRTGRKMKQRQRGKISASPY